MLENCKQEKLFIKAHIPRRPQEIYMVESNERVEKGGTHPIQGSEGDCNAITGFSEELQSLRPVRGSAGAMLLKARNAQMSAVQHLVALSLFLGRTRKKVCFKILIS